MSQFNHGDNATVMKLANILGSELRSWGFKSPLSHQFMLIDSQTKKPLKFKRLHGNTKVRNLITGKKDRTAAQWRRMGKESAQRLIKAFADFKE